MVVNAVAEGGVVIKQILLERLTQARAGELSLRSAGAHLEGGDGLLHLKFHKGPTTVEDVKLIAMLALEHDKFGLLVDGCGVGWVGWGWAGVGRGVLDFGVKGWGGAKDCSNAGVVVM